MNTWGKVSGVKEFKESDMLSCDQQMHRPQCPSGRHIPRDETWPGSITHLVQLPVELRRPVFLLLRRVLTEEENESTPMDIERIMVSVHICRDRRCLWVNCQLQAQGSSKGCCLNGFKDSICTNEPSSWAKTGLETQELY